MKPRLISRFNDAKSIIGLYQALRLCGHWLVQREYDLLCLDLKKYNPLVIEQGEAGWEYLKPDDLYSLSLVNPGLDQDEALSRLNDGQQCIIVRINDSIVHYRWECSTQTHLGFVDLGFAAWHGDLLSVEVYTGKEYRCRGIHKQATLWAASLAQKRGFKRFLCFVAPWHLPTRNIWLDTLKAEQIGRITYRPITWGKGHILSGALQLNADGRVCLPGSVKVNNRQANPNLLD